MKDKKGLAEGKSKRTIYRDRQNAGEFGLERERVVKHTRRK